MITQRASLFAAAALAAAMAMQPALGAGGAGGGGGGAGGGGGGGGGGMQIATQHGLYVVDLPMPGEASMTGWVLAAFAGSYFTPEDTVVTVNGVQLIHAPGLVPMFFIVDPNGPQPAVAVDGMLHITASSASTKSTRTLNLPCPSRVVVSTSPAAGASLGGAGALDMAWSPLPQNPSLFVTGAFSMDPPTARLWGYDLATGVTGEFVGQSFLGQTSTGTSIPVQPTASTGYMSELKYPGLYVLDGNSGGYCGRAQRYTYTQ